MAASIWSSDTSMKPKPLGRPDSFVGMVAPDPPHWEQALSRSASEVLKERFPTNSRLLIGPFDRSLRPQGRGQVPPWITFAWSGMTAGRQETQRGSSFPGDAPQRA